MPNYHILITVVVQVRQDQSTTDAMFAEIVPSRGAKRLKAGSVGIPPDQSGLSIGGVLAQQLTIVIHMPIGNDQV